VTLTSDDAAQLSVWRGGSSAPNTFMLVPPAAPAYAFGNHVVHLTAKATPGKKSGAKAVSRSRRYNGIHYPNRRERATRGRTGSGRKRVVRRAVG
jgi:hypothetical protein